MQGQIQNASETPRGSVQPVRQATARSVTTGVFEKKKRNEFKEATLAFMLPVVRSTTRSRTVYDGTDLSQSDIAPVLEKKM
jgi:hypothetical protein